MYSAECKDLDFVQFLLDKGADPNILDSKKRTAFDYAESIGIRATLLNKAKETMVVREGTQEEKNAAERNLYVAAAISAPSSKGYTNTLIQKVQEVGGNINIPMLGSALMEAARTGDANAFDALIDAGADVSVRDRNNFTALMKAAQSNNPKIVEKLIAAGVDLKATNNGDTALDLAGKNEDIKAMLTDAMFQKEVPDLSALASDPPLEPLKAAAEHAYENFKETGKLAPDSLEALGRQYAEFILPPPEGEGSGPEDTAVDQIAKDACKDKTYTRAVLDQFKKIEKRHVVKAVCILAVVALTAVAVTAAIGFYSGVGAAAVKAAVGTTVVKGAPMASTAGGKVAATTRGPIFATLAKGGAFVTRATPMKVADAVRTTCSMCKATHLTPQMAKQAITNLGSVMGAIAGKIPGIARGAAFGV